MGAEGGGKKKWEFPWGFVIGIALLVGAFRSCSSGGLGGFSRFVGDQLIAFIASATIGGGIVLIVLLPQIIRSRKKKDDQQ